MSREALAAGLDQTFSKPERIRPWTYDFDPSGLELLRRAIDHVTASRPVEAVAGLTACPRGPSSRHGPRAMLRRCGPSTSGATRANGTRVDRALLGVRGDLVVADLAGIRRLADADEPPARPGRRPRSRPATSVRSGCSTRSATCSIARYEADHRPGAIAERPRRARGSLGPDATRLLDRFGEEFPGPAPAPEPPAHPARGAAADPHRQREPRGRAAARADRRSRRWRTARATARRSPGSRRRSPAGQPIDGDGLSLSS